VKSGFFGPLPEYATSLAKTSGNWEVFQFDEMKLSFFSLFRKQTLFNGESETDIRTLGPRDYLRELRKRRNSKQWGTNKRFVRDHTYFYEAATVPLSCLFLPVVGICLGISDPRRRPGYAYLALGFVLFCYYATVMICQQLALRFWVPPELTLVVPPLVILSLTALLMRWRSVFPPSTSFWESVFIDGRALKKKLVKWVEPQVQKKGTEK
jgi:lipopolysaccharide export LptBFGC system permease protein LptF